MYFDYAMVIASEIRQIQRYRVKLVPSAESRLLTLSSETIKLIGTTV
jgi:hypothetical protein